MERKEYQKPMTKVVKLQHQMHLLQASEQEEPQGRKQQYESQSW